MPEPADQIVELVRTTVSETVRFSRAAERLMTISADIHRALLGLSSLAEADPELAPEIRATLDALETAHEAVSRATVFVSTRLQTSLERAVGAPLDDWPTL